MLLDEFVTTKWNSKTKKYYLEKGYVFTKMSDDLVVKVFDLADNSFANVNVKCDYCFKNYIVKWHHRIRTVTNGSIKKDACTKCKHFKAKESVFLKYGVNSVMNVPEFKDKLKNTFLEIYGVDNPYKSEFIKEKIAKTNLKKYGVISFTKTEEYLIKSKNTSMLRYGCSNYSKTLEFKERNGGENSVLWKGGINDERWDRLQPVYKTWRNSVFSRDNFICKKCNLHKTLNAHHICNWKDNIEFRYVLDNGISLCVDCHNKFHSIYGKKNNNLEQILEFLNNDKEICRTNEN